MGQCTLMMGLVAFVGEFMLLTEDWLIDRSTKRHVLKAGKYWNNTTHYSLSARLWNPPIGGYWLWLIPLPAPDASLRSWRFLRRLQTTTQCQRASLDGETSVSGDQILINSDCNGFEFKGSRNQSSILEYCSKRSALARTSHVLSTDCSGFSPYRYFGRVRSVQNGRRILLCSLASISWGSESHGRRLSISFFSRMETWVDSHPLGRLGHRHWKRCEGYGQNYDLWPQWLINALSNWYRCILPNGNRSNLELREG